MTKNPSDDLEAVRTLVETLQGFDVKDQERIIRWASEKIGLAPSTPHQPVTFPGKGDDLEARSDTPAASSEGGRPDIKSFVTEKSPANDVHFAAVVAYYYQFAAAENEKKEAINGEDLQEACRKASRSRLASPSNTLNNALKRGLLDKTGERGAYKINSVGENLVAMTLPGGTQATNTARRVRKREANHRKSKNAKSKPSKTKLRARQT